MDLEDQGRIKELTEEYGKDDIVVLLGAPTTEASQVQFETVTTGDPSYAGPLAGVELGLQAYHVFEPNVKAAIDPDQYAENIEILEMGLDAEAIVGALAEMFSEWALLCNVLWRGFRGDTLFYCLAAETKDTLE